MIRIGITGGIGSGKSVVSHILKNLGIPVYIADNEAKRLMVSHPDIREDLVNLLGEEVYSTQGVNKDLLAKYLFSCPENTKKINSIIHPRVKKDILCWYQENKHKPILAMESAILFEAGFEDTIDYVILVYAPQNIRIGRVIKRDNTTPNLVQKRITTQLNDQQKLNKADFLIINDDSTPLLEQILLFVKYISTEKKP